MVKVAGVMEKSAAVMSAMQQLVRLPEIQATMMQLSKEMTKAGLIEEMMEDSFDNVFESEELDEEAEVEVSKVLMELTDGAFADVIVPDGALVSGGPGGCMTSRWPGACHHVFRVPSPPAVARPSSTRHLDCESLAAAACRSRKQGRRRPKRRRWPRRRTQRISVPACRPSSRHNREIVRCPCGVHQLSHAPRPCTEPRATPDGRAQHGCVALFGTWRVNTRVVLSPPTACCRDPTSHPLPHTRWNGHRRETYVRVSTCYGVTRMI